MIAMWRRRLAELVEERTARRWLVALGCLDVLLVWCLPVFPAQDLPQHLAYARVFADHATEPTFQALYELPARFQPYFVSHHVMAALTKVSTLQVALKTLLSVYVVAMLAAFEVLARASQRDEPSTRFTALLGALLVWNPILSMGFLEFALALPLVLWGAALVLRSGADDSRRSTWAGLAASGIATASLHVVAAGLLLLFAILHALFNPTRRRAAAAVCVAAACTASHLLWSMLGEHGLGSFDRLPWTDAMRAAIGLEFLSNVLRIDWHDPLQKLGHVFATVAGPYRYSGQLVTMSLFAAALWLASSRPPRPATPSGRPVDGRVRRSALAFAVASWLLPWGMYVPSEITFLDLRAFTIAFALALAAAPTARWLDRRARWALVLVAFGSTGHFAIRALRFAHGEAAPVLALMAEAEPRGMMLPLVFHDESEEFGKQFRVTHFLPMYYTAVQRGPTSQFWGRYTHHLPIGYRSGRKPRAPADWHPGDLERQHLDAFDWIVVQAPTADDPAEARRDYARVMELLAPHTRRVRCASLWCLYRNTRSEDSIDLDAPHGRS